MKRMTRAIRLFTAMAATLASLSCFAACDPLLGDTLFYFDEKTFKAEWNKWNDQNMQDYTYIITGYMHPYPRGERMADAAASPRALLMLPYEAKVVVKDGAFDSYAYFNSTDQNFSCDPDLFEANSVNSLHFTSISQMYQSIYDWAKEVQADTSDIKNSPGMKSFRFELKYDRAAHYPSFFYPSIEPNPGWIFDTPLHPVSISGLVPLAQ